MDSLFTRRLAAFFLSICLIGAGAPLHAGVIGTHTMIELEDQNARVAKISAALARDDVRAQLIKMGVDPAAAQQRVAALTDSELTLLDGQIDKLPAGGGALAILGVVFIVILLLEVIGVIDIFKKV